MLSQTESFFVGKIIGCTENCIVVRVDNEDPVAITTGFSKNEFYKNRGYLGNEYINFIKVNKENRFLNFVGCENEYE